MKTACAATRLRTGREQAAAPGCTEQLGQKIEARSHCRCCSRAAAAHRVRAGTARCSTRAPERRWDGVGRPRSGHRHGEGMDARVEATQERLPEADAFSSVHGCAVEKPDPDPRTFRPWMGKKRQAGWLSLGSLSLWPSKEKVTRVPKAHESSCRAPMRSDTASNRTRKPLQEST